LLQALAGARRVQQGTIQLNGRPVKTQSRRGVIRSGIAYCSGDRKKDGLFAIRPVIETITVPALHTVSPGGWMSRGRELNLARTIAKFFTIDSRRLGSRARNLSGGNQQKVALGKWMSASPKVLMVEEPTIGVDVGARADIYTHLRSLANEGMAVIFASSDIQEVIGLADTIATFHKGRLIGHVAGDKADSATIMRDVTHPPEDESA
jgi:ribose transport system ATP-binding protein/rhamnose transport system ATP-binding protein